MSVGPLQALVDRLRQAGPGRAGGLSDAELLDRWARHHDEAAFELIVWRHGRLVLSVCRRLLRHAPDVEDAFQATFLVLVRKARSIARGQGLASWLHTVATRVGLRLRERSARESARATGGVESLPCPSAAMAPGDDLRAVLDEEVGRLSEKHRTVFVLCCLEGKTDESAARELGCPVGTVLSRLSRARQRLRERLTRRGMAPGLALPALVEAANLPSGLLESTVSAAAALAAGTSPAAPAAVALMEGVVHAMFVTKLKSASIAVVALAMLGLGGLAGYGGLGAQEAGSSSDRPARGGGGTTRPARAAQRDTTARDLERQLEQAQAQLAAAQATVERLQRALKAAQDRKAATKPVAGEETRRGSETATAPVSSLDLLKAKVAAATAEHDSAQATLAEAKRRLVTAEKLLAARAITNDEVELLKTQVLKFQAEADRNKAMQRIAELELARISKSKASQGESSYGPATPSLEKRVKALEDQLREMRKEMDTLRGRRGSTGTATLPSRSGR